MKITIGNDIIEISRIESLIERYEDHFLKRVFTEKECLNCSERKYKASYFAGRFAAKEAIVKALGTGIGSLVQWHDLEILNNDKGKPIVFVSDKVKDNFGELSLEISISHCKEYASAVALCIR